MKAHFERVNKMAANRGLTKIVALADEALGLCNQVNHESKMALYDGSRTAKEFTQAQNCRDSRIDACNVRLAEIMTITNGDQSWITAPLLSSPHGIAA